MSRTHWQTWLFGREYVFVGNVAFHCFSVDDWKQKDLGPLPVRDRLALASWGVESRARPHTDGDVTWRGRNRTCWSLTEMCCLIFLYQLCLHVVSPFPAGICWGINAVLAWVPQKAKPEAKVVYCWPSLGGSVGWSIVHRPKGCRFDPWSGHIARLWVRSQVGVHPGGNQLMFLSLFHFLSLSNQYPWVRIFFKVVYYCLKSIPPGELSKGHSIKAGGGRAGPPVHTAPAALPCGSLLGEAVRTPAPQGGLEGEGWERPAPLREGLGLGVQSLHLFGSRSGTHPKRDQGKGQKSYNYKVCVRPPQT